MSTPFPAGSPVWLNGHKGRVAQIGTWTPTGEALFVVDWWSAERWNGVRGEWEPLRVYTSWQRVGSLTARKEANQ